MAAISNNDKRYEVLAAEQFSITGRLNRLMSDQSIAYMTSLYAQALDLCHQILKPALLKARNASFLGSVLTWVQGALKLARSKHQSTCGQNEDA